MQAPASEPMPFPSRDNDDALNHWLDKRLRIWPAADASEEAYLQEVLTTKREAIASIDSRVLELQAQVHALKQSRAILELQLTKCQSLFSPIRRLPSELLIEIFQYLDFQTALYFRRVSVRTPSQCHTSWSRNDATLVSTVCWSWNTLLCSVPKFWNSFGVVITCSTVAVLRAEVLVSVRNMLCNALKRSMAAPLTIRISVIREWRYLSDILSPFLEEAHRWKNLAMNIPLGYLADAGLRDLGGSLTNLEVLECRGWSGRHDEANNANRWFANVPRLKEVVLSNLGLELFNLPWKQIESLTVENESDALQISDIRILGSATSLRSLKCRFEFAETPLQSVVFPLPITSLDVAFQEDLDFLASSFEFPFLTELKIRDIWTSVSSFVTRVAPTLQRLELELMEPGPFPLAVLGPDTYFPELIELSVASGEEAKANGDVHFGVEQDYLISIGSRFPRLTRFECELEEVMPRDSRVHAWALTLLQIAQRPGEDTEVRLRLHGPVAENDLTVQWLRKLIREGAAIEIRLGHYVTWMLDASDVETSDSFRCSQNIRLGLPSRAYQRRE